MLSDQYTMTDTRKLKLTTASVKKRCVPADSGKPVLYWDTEIKGFGVKVTPHSQTFIVQKDIAGRSRRVTIGRFGEWTTDEARKHARELVVQMDKGIDPNQEKRTRQKLGVTLAEAIEMHVNGMKAKRCAQKSIESVEFESARHLPDWLQRPLASVTRNECATRHERITKASGPYAANRALQQFRAVYNTAIRRMEGLPPNPTVGVTFNKTRRRREPIRWADLPVWRATVDGIQNPIRRDLQLFMLFTGLRSTDARTVRWEHVDFKAGTVHRPNPKGGEDHAFTVPLAAVALDLLRLRRMENKLIYLNDGGWAFPSQNMKGQVTYVAQAKEQRYDKNGKKVGILPSPHRLRDTFASAAHEARIHPLDLKVLMIHRLAASDDVTEGYIRPSVEHLRESVDRVAKFLHEKMGAEDKPALRSVG